MVYYLRIVILLVIIYINYSKIDKIEDVDSTYLYINIPIHFLNKLKFESLVSY